MSITDIEQQQALLNVFYGQSFWRDVRHVGDMICWIDAKTIHVWEKINCVFFIIKSAFLTRSRAIYRYNNKAFYFSSESQFNNTR